MREVHRRVDETPGTMHVAFAVTASMRGLFVLTALVAVCAVSTSVVLAQHSSKGHQSNHSERKYDFAIVREHGGISNWGNTDEFNSEQLKAKGPGLYFKKDGQLMVIRDPETLRKVEQAQEPMKQVGEKMRALGKERKLDKNFEKRTKEQGEIGKKMGEEARAYSQALRNHDEGARDKFQKRMAELRERMQTLSAQQRDHGAMMGEWGRKMGALGSEMGQRAREAGEKIDRLIDESIARGLAKRA